MNLLEMNHIRKTFDDLEVIKDISLSVKEGEILSIIGPSGSGKSTLLRCATMLEEIDGGEILYMGERAAWMEGKKACHPGKAQMKRLQEYFGLVFQSFNLFPHYSVMKNLTDAPINIQKRNKEEVYREARELLAKMGLEDKEDAYPCQLSGGQCQRVAIARAVLRDSPILLLDEATSALDVTTERTVLKNIVQQHPNKTCIVTTHRPSVLNLCQRVYRVMETKVTELSEEESSRMAMDF